MGVRREYKPGSAAVPQPDPLPGKTVVYEYALKDIGERVEMGKIKYGTPLKTQNGRDALYDCYQELIDALLYIRQELLERDGK